MTRPIVLNSAALVTLLAASMAPSYAAAATAHVTPMRVVQVDLDYVSDADPAQQQRNLDALIKRIAGMNISAVFLQAFADPKGTGLASELYFPNHYLPMRADLFGTAVSRLKAEAGVKVFGWLPVLSFDLKDMPVVEAWNPATDTAEASATAYRRLSPFAADARAKITGIYEDMAQSAPIDGLLFHDDALLSDFEDASPEALDAYKAAGFPTSIADIRADKELMDRWTDFKTTALIEFTHDLTKAAEKARGRLITVRNMYAPVALQPNSQEWFAQNYDRFLNAYDYTAVEAMPQMEQVPDEDADAWMNRLLVTASRRAAGLSHTIFELQSVDWRKQGLGRDRAIPTETMASEMRYLTKQGALNFGYYPDDFVTNTPNAEMLHKDFSLPTSSYPL